MTHPLHLYLRHLTSLQEEMGETLSTKSRLNLMSMDIMERMQVRALVCCAVLGCAVVGCALSVSTCAFTQIYLL